jgi:hypothetical protein
VAGDAVLIAPVSRQIPCKWEFYWDSTKTLLKRNVYSASKALDLHPFPSRFSTEDNREKTFKNRQFARVSREKPTGRDMCERRPITKDEV